MNKRRTLILSFISLSTVILVLIFVFKNSIWNKNNNYTPINGEGQVLVEAKSVCEQKLQIQGLYPINNYEGAPALVNFSKFPKAKLYYTAITESASLGPNFAGHFTVITWGCGTDCFQYAVVDAITGEIIAYSSANNGYHLRRSHRLDNYYLILDPVYAGEERKYYGITEDKDNVSRLNLVCTEISEKDMYGPPE